MPIPNASVALVEGALGIPPDQTDNITVVLAHCSIGTANALYDYSNSSPTAVKTANGVGKGPQLVSSILQTPNHGPVILIPLATSVGTNSAVTATGTSPPTTTLTGTPLDDYLLRVECRTAGARGVATFRYSLDNGTNWSADITTAATYLMTDTGVTLNFANTAFSTDNVWTATCVAPVSSNGQVTAALDALIASGRDVGWVHIAVNLPGSLDTDRATALASMFAAVDTKITALQTAYKYVGCSLETSTPVATDAAGLTTWRAALVAAAPALVSNRMMIVAGRCTMTSDMDARSYLRPSAWPVVCRISCAPISEHLGRVRSGALRAVTALEHDEETTGGLDTSRFTTLRTIAGRSGFWCTGGRQFSQPGSDYSTTQNLRVINRASKIGRNALIGYLNDDLVLDSATGYIREDEAKAIDIDLTSQLQASLAGHCSSTSARVGRADNIISTSTITGEFKVQPKGYASFINFSLGFTKTGAAGAL